MLKQRNKAAARAFKDETTSAWFITGIVFAFLLIAAVVVFIVWGEKLTHLPGQCAFYSVTGLYCPGCGGTRSFNAFVHGHIISSFILNPFVPYTLIAYLVFMINTILVRNTRKLGFTGLPATVLVYIGVGILLGQCLIRNIIFKCYGLTCL